MSEIRSIFCSETNASYWQKPMKTARVKFLRADDVASVVQPSIDLLRAIDVQAVRAIGPAAGECQVPWETIVKVRVAIQQLERLADD